MAYSQVDRFGRDPVANERPPFDEPLAIEVLPLHHGKAETVSSDPLTMPETTLTPAFIDSFAPLFKKEGTEAFKRGQRAIAIIADMGVTSCGPATEADKSLLLAVAEAPSQPVALARLDTMRHLAALRRG